MSCRWTWWRGFKELIDISEDGIALVMQEFGLGENENFLLLIDQFEEIFRYRSKEEDKERERLVELLLRGGARKAAGPARHNHDAIRLPR